MSTSLTEALTISDYTTAESEAVNGLIATVEQDEVEVGGYTLTVRNGAMPPHSSHHFDSLKEVVSYLDNGGVAGMTAADHWMAIGEDGEPQEDGAEDALILSTSAMRRAPMRDEELNALRERMAQGRTVSICPTCKVEPDEHSMHQDWRGGCHVRCPVCLTELLNVELRPAIDPLNSCGTDAETLLEEVEQLRYQQNVADVVMERIDAEGWRTQAAFDALRAENAALRAIVEAVPAQSWYTHSSTLTGTLVQSACCPFPQCEQESCDDWRDIPHTPDCPVTQARALVRQWPAETAESE